MCKGLSDFLRDLEPFTHRERPGQSDRPGSAGGLAGHFQAPCHPMGARDMLIPNPLPYGGLVPPGKGPAGPYPSL